MKEQEKLLAYPHGTALPEPGGSITVAPGVKWLRMVLPFQLDHIHVWLLRDRIDGQDGWTVVDTGIASDDNRARWESVFASELEQLPVLRVIVTHMHPDHIGLADWLCQRWNARLWMSASEFQAAQLALQGITSFSGEHAAEFAATHGMTDEQTRQRLMERDTYYQALVPAVPVQFRRLQDGEQFCIGQHLWTCISGAGHTQEHLALYCADLHVLIAGDMLLPAISTHVDVNVQEPEANALQRFLTSIRRFLDLPADTLVLPSHGRPFIGAHLRVQQLADHHQERLDELLQACTAGPCSATDAMRVLFRRPLDFHQTTFALSESIAHLHALWHAGQVTRHKDAQGVFRFTVPAVA